MAYDRTTWVNEETPLNADNLNNIEDGIEEALDGAAIDSSTTALFASLGWTPPE